MHEYQCACYNTQRSAGHACIRRTMLWIHTEDQYHTSLPTYTFPLPPLYLTSVHTLARTLKDKPVMLYKEDKTVYWDGEPFKKVSTLLFQPLRFPYLHLYWTSLFIWPITLWTAYCILILLILSSLLKTADVFTFDSCSLSSGYIILVSSSSKASQSHYISL